MKRFEVYRGNTLVGSGSTPLTRTLPRRPMIGERECHVQAEESSATRSSVSGRDHQPGFSRIQANAHVAINLPNLRSWHP